MAAEESTDAELQRDLNVHISFEDQQKINKFARHNAIIEEYKKELQQKREEVQSIKDACSELELFDDDAKIPYHIGETFVNQDLSKTLSCLEKVKEKTQLQINDLEEKCASVYNLMSELKAQLYAKLGNHINLEADEE